MQRRQFIKTSVSTGAVVGAWAALGGCGDNGTETSGDATRTYDSSASHRARITLSQPTIDVEASLTSLTPLERQKVLAYIDELDAGSDGNGIEQSRTFHFHCGQSKTMQTVVEKARSAPDKDTTLHVVENEFATHKASIFYVTHTIDTPADDGRDVGLSFMYLYIPPKSVRDGDSEQACSSSPVQASSDTNATSSVACHVAVDIVVSDPVAETIRALLFSHPALHQLRADRAEAIIDAVDLTDLNGYDMLKAVLSIGMKRERWYVAKKMTDPDSQTTMVFEYGVYQGKPMYQYHLADMLRPFLADPMHDLVTRIGNDSSLKNIFRHTPGTVDTGTVDTSRAATWRRSVKRESGLSHLKQTGSGRIDGFEIALSKTGHVGSGHFSDFLPSHAPTATLRLRNYFRHYVAFYLRYRDLDGRVVKAQTVAGKKGRDAWFFIGGNDYSAGIYNDYMDDETYLMHLLGGPLELLGTPLERYSEGSIEFAFPENAHSATLYAVTLGNAGARDSLMEKLPVGMTMTFDLILPQVFLALSFAIRNERMWVKLVASNGLSFVSTFIKALIESSANKGHSTASVAGVAASVGGNILLSLIRKQAGKLAKFLVAEIGAEEIENSTPILGMVLMVANIAVDAAELGRTGYSISHSEWTAYTRVSRSHALTLQILPDANNFQFPEVADRVVIVLRSAGRGVSLRFSGKKDKYVGNVAVSTITGEPIPTGTILFPAGSADKTEALIYTFDDVPEGGQIDVDVYFTAGSLGYVTAHAKYRIGNVGKTVVAFRVRQIKVVLSEQSIYAHKRITRFKDAKLRWIETDRSPQTVYNLASDGVQPGEISKLLSIAINDKSGALGYSFSTEFPDGTFRTVVRNISAKTMEPEEGAKRYISAQDDNTFVLYDMLAEPKLPDRNFVLLLKDDPLLGKPLYFAKSISIDPASNRFGISATKNFGKFSVAIDAAAYDPVHRVIAGIDAKNRRIHLLPLSETDLEDSSEVYADNVYSVPKNIPGNPSASSGAESLLDVLFEPVLIAFTATGSLMIVDQHTPVGDIVRFVSAKGSPLELTEFGGAYAVLRKETAPTTYLDMSVDSDGYFFILKRVGPSDAAVNYKLDLYGPDGMFLSQTSGMAAHKMRSDYWRNIYTLNYERTSADGKVEEPTVSIWVPPVSGGETIGES